MFVWTWVPVLVRLAHLGPNLMMIRLIPEHRETGKLASLRGLLRGGRLLAVGPATMIAIACAAGLWLLSPYIDSH